MIRLVPDTNILISSVFWRGKPYEVIRKGIEGLYALLTSAEILEEFAGCMLNKFDFPEQEPSLLKTQSFAFLMSPFMEICSRAAL